MIIDTHQHFWKYETEKHAWIDDAMHVIRKDFLPEDLAPIYRQNGIDGCIAVQADQTEEENNFLLQLAAKNNFIKGIIGWVNFRANDIDERLQYYAAFDKIKGFRHVVQGEPDPNFILRPDFLNGIKKLEQYNFCYEILVFPHQLGAVLEFVKKFPNIKFVIDHIAKPYIKDGFFDGWATLIAEIAKFPNVYCKLSGMVTEADYDSWNYQQLQFYIAHILECFSIKRVMYGSDWPVCLVAATYKQVLEVATTAVSNYSNEDKDAFWYKNAINFYNL